MTDDKQGLEPMGADVKPDKDRQTAPTGGLEIPVPTRDEIMDVFRRFVLLKPKR